MDNAFNQVLRPGLLVSLRTTIRGGIRYDKETVEPEHREGESSKAAWKTTRLIADAEEHARAVEARGRARTAITRVCCPTSFGLLCPQSAQPELAAAIAEAQSIASEHNVTARHSRVDVYAIVGRIADNDVQAAQAISAEVRELLDAMTAGIRAADPAAIREAANKARAMAGMLSPEVQSKMSDALREARGIAREIVRRVEKAGEVAADVVQGIKLSAIENARFAVLDLTDDGAPPPGFSDGLEAPARAVDLMPVDEAPAPAYAGPSTLTLEL